MRIEKRDNNKVYLYNTSADWIKPQYITCYWEVKNIDSSLIESGMYIEKFAGVWITKINGKIIPLYINDYPDFNEVIEIKPPKKTGYKWINGDWVKVK